MVPSYLAQIITAFITGIFSQNIIQHVLKRKFRKLNVAIESKAILGDCSIEFREKFVLTNLEEEYFYIQTGIRTNHKSIFKYIELKEKLGNNYTWEKIRIANPHLRFEDSGLTVSIHKAQKIFKNIALILGFSLLSVGVLLLAFHFPHVKTKGEIILGLMFFFGPALIGHGFVSSVQSIVTAGEIERRLLKLARSNDNVN